MIEFEKKTVKPDCSILKHSLLSPFEVVSSTQREKKKEAFRISCFLPLCKGACSLRFIRGINFSILPSRYLSNNIWAEVHISWEV
ncbi:hypothetical protein V6N11_002067 [Hibiscus sabdariffa]|uniref:Uncharacterized protein n=1 Tax=Hibiscus sabdariffa TaxID=183260 RepID=A0ABR2QU61_9ROSI